jgi:hypothetical protein
MSNPMGDFRSIAIIPEGEVSQWIRNRYPKGPRAAWWNAILEAALLCSSDPAEDADSPLLTAATLLRLAEDADGMPAHYIAEWYLAFARQASRHDSTGIPSEFMPDAVARRAVAAIKLSPAEAIATARRQREQRLRELSGEAILDEPVTQDDRSLTVVRLLTASFDWLVHKVTDSRVEEALQQWLLVQDKLFLGEEVAELNRRRLQETTRRNRIQELRLQAIRGKTAAEMALWLKSMLGRKFSFGAFLDYFSDAFFVELSELRGIEGWCGFDAGGDLSDAEFNSALWGVIL